MIFLQDKHGMVLGISRYFLLRVRLSSNTKHPDSLQQVIHFFFFTGTDNLPDYPGEGNDGNGEDHYAHETNHTLLRNFYDTTFVHYCQAKTETVFAQKKYPL